jgi:hypothetical protein
VVTLSFWQKDGSNTSKIIMQIPTQWQPTTANGGCRPGLWLTLGVVLQANHAALGLELPEDCPGRRFQRLSALRTHTKPPYKTDLL